MHLKEKEHVPDPGSAQPKGGFSTLKSTGGGFNTSVTPGFIDKHLKDKEHVPDADYEVREQLNRKTFNAVSTGQQRSAARRRMKKAIHAVRTIAKMNKSFKVLAAFGTPMGQSFVAKEQAAAAPSASRADMFAKLRAADLPAGPTAAEAAAEVPSLAGAAAGGAGSKQAAGASGLVAGRRKSFEAEDFYSALEADRAAEVEKGMGAEEQASVAAKGALAAVAKPAGAAEPAARGGRRMSFEAEDAQMAAFSAASAAAAAAAAAGGGGGGTGGAEAEPAPAPAAAAVPADADAVKGGDDDDDYGDEFD
jgi:hypothetical protein